MDELEEEPHINEINDERALQLFQIGNVLKNIEEIEELGDNVQPLDDQVELQSDTEIMGEIYKTIVVEGAVKMMEKHKTTCVFKRIKIHAV